MTRLACLSSLVLLLAAACDGGSNKPADAPATTDGPPRDALADVPVAPDAAPDAAVPSTVHVVPGCTGVSTGDIAATITTVGFAFSRTAATIPAGAYVEFTTTGFHNFQNQPGAPADATFSSGSPGAQTACLQFTVAGSYPFECVVHAGMGMTGTLTVD